MLSRNKRLVLGFLVATLFASTGWTTVALASCDDGDAAANNIVCDTDPVAADNYIGLGLGDDTYVQNDGVTTEIVDGDAQADGSASVGNGGNDHITINGTVLLCVNGDHVTGDGGQDTIIINGEVQCSVNGDGGDTNNGGNDRIEIHGEVTGSVYGDWATGNGGDDTIIIYGEVEDVYGDDAGGDGGDDKIVIYGEVDYIYGDEVGGAPGSDTITIYGIVNDDIYADDGGFAGGDDVVIIGDGAYVGGTIFGDAGTDTLAFEMFTQAELDALGLDPAGGTITIGGNLFSWLDFERLVGLLQRIIESGVRIYYRSGLVFAADASDFSGISVFAPPGRIAFISYDVVDKLNSGDSRIFKTNTSEGWYVVVTNLGQNPDAPGNELFSVNIFNPAGISQGQFTFSH
jgi:hypothetical protein